MIRGPALRQGASGARRLGIAGLATLVVACALACTSGPPRDPDDLCSIFRERRSWYHGAVRARERWGVPEAVQIAIIHQESSFRAEARPPRRRWLGFLPGARPSSAYGYGQVIDPTWARYRRATGRGDAARDEFADVTDFIGWYGDRIHRRTGIPKQDASRLYLAYHEGASGYLRGSHQSKGWLAGASRQVGARAARYQRQYDACRDELPPRRGLWPF